MTVVTFQTQDGRTGLVDTKGSLETLYDYLISGPNSGRLSSEDRFEVYCLGDGFGDTSSGEGREWLRNYCEGGYDWSHVRDSSPESIVRMVEEVIRRQK